MFVVIPQRKIYGVWSIRRGTGSTCRKQSKCGWQAEKRDQLSNSYLRIQMLPWHPSSLLLASLVALLLQDISEVGLSSLGYQFCACLHLFLHQAGVEMKHERQGTRYLQYNVTQKIYFAQICRTQEVYFSLSRILPLLPEHWRTPMQKREQRVRTSVFLPRPSCSVLSWTHRQL